MEIQDNRGRIQEGKSDNKELQERNIQMHHIEGEKNAELANLRGDTSK